MIAHEYVVWDIYDDCIHRGPWPEDECLTWMQECRDMFSDGNIDLVWEIRRRPVGKWETYEVSSY